MDNRKTLFKFFLSFILILTSICAQAKYDFKVDKIYYEINSDKQTVNVTSSISTIVSSGMVNMDYAGDVIIPETVTYNNKVYTVTGVDDFCTFKYAKALRSVNFPATIKTLPTSTFYGCSALNKVVLSDNLEAIPEDCFLNCTALSQINIPNSVELIGESAFQGCSSISSLIIPSSVNRIEDSAFVGCTALSQITFSDSSNLLRIGYGYYEGEYKGAFDDCPLFNIYMGRNITNLYTSNVYNMDDVFAGHKTLSEITLGQNVTKLYSRLFEKCVSLTSIEVQGSNLKEVQDYAFQECRKLQDLKGNALNSVEIIGKFAFSGCPLLKEISLPNITSLDKSAFYSYNGTMERVLIGDNISVIPERCFYGQSHLKYVYLGSGLSDIQNYAFDQCKGLVNVFLFSDKLVTIGANAIPSTVSKIFVPSVSRYENLLKSYSTDFLIIVNPTTTTYSGIVPNFSCVNNVIDSNVDFSSSYLNLNVGEYNIPISVKFSSGTWSSSTLINCSYTILPAPLTVIANDASRKYGTENPELTCSFFGFKNGETKDVLTRMPNVETTATITSNVGTYPIIATGAEAQNYTFNYERGTLTITKADQTIEWEQQFGTVNVGDVMELTATSSAGLPIKYTSTDETIAEIFSQRGKQFVEFLKPGNVSIRASQDGNENYNGADRVSKSVKVDLLVSGITLTQNSATLAEGKSLQLTATVSPDNASNKTLSWTSANPEIATVDANGKVKALKQGKTTITVKSTDGSDISTQCELTVIKLVEDISINITTATLTEGQSLQLEAIVSPELATNKAVEWSSNNESVAIVSQQGKVSAISKGSAIITAKSTDGSNVSASCNVNVIKLVSGIVLSESEMTLNEGQSATLTATVTPELANNKTLAWTSSNESVATVSSQGKVTAISKGTAIITATSTDGSNLSASCTVNVVKLVSGIVLSETEMTLNEGQSAQLTAIVSSDANNKTLAWSSNNEAVATVTQDGKVTAKSKGTAIITVKATDGSNVSASCTVNVVKLVSGIVLSESEITLNEGQSTQLTATVTPDLANNKTLSWSSSNEAIAIVTQEGKITAISKGTAIITATSTDGPNVSASCRVNVVKLVSGIVLNETEMTLNEGQSAQLTAIVSSDANNKTLAWSSSNEAVAMVTQDGKVTAKSKGTAVITVKATDGSNISASCIINVVKPVSNIILSESEITLNEGESSTLTATVLPDLASNKTLVWSSNKIGVATVDQNGNVTAISRGIAVITAKSTDGSNISASCTVNVVKLVSSIHIDPTTVTLKVGEQATISAYALPADATNPTLNWYSDNSTIASVEDGVVTAIKEGHTIIVVETTDGSNISERCRVKVEKRSAIDYVSSDEIKVSVSNGTITILNVPVNQMAQILQTNGTTVKKQISTGEVISYQPANKGVYIIVVGNETFKVVI